jgi:hypothetical protein
MLAVLKTFVLFAISNKHALQGHYLLKKVLFTLRQDCPIRTDNTRHRPVRADNGRLRQIDAAVLRVLLMARTPQLHNRRKRPP